VIRLEDSYTRLNKEHPDWDHKTLIAMTEANSIKDAGETSMSSVLERSTSLSLSRFSTLIKAIKTRHSLKAPHMGH